MMDDIYFSCSCVGSNWYVVLPISSPSWTIVHIKASGNITLESVMEEHCNTHRGSRDMRFGGNRIIANLVCKCIVVPTNPHNTNVLYQLLRMY